MRINKQERISLLKESNFMQHLSLPQVFTLIYWEWFSKDKYNLFFHYLKIGKTTKYAFEDAKKQDSIR